MRVWKVKKLPSVFLYGRLIYCHWLGKGVGLGVCVGIAVRVGVTVGGTGVSLGMTVAVKGKAVSVNGSVG